MTRNCRERSSSSRSPLPERLPCGPGPTWSSHQSSASSSSGFSPPPRYPAHPRNSAASGFASCPKPAACRPATRGFSGTQREAATWPYGLGDRLKPNRLAARSYRRTVACSGSIRRQRRVRRLVGVPRSVGTKKIASGRGDPSAGPQMGGSSPANQVRGRVGPNPSYWR